MKINIGSGMDRVKGFIRCDKDPKVEPFWQFDCETELWPFEKNSVDEVLAENLLEHLKNIDHFFEEAYRVLKPDGCLTIKVPHYMAAHAYSDPDHIRYFTPDSFMYWSRTTKGSDGRPVKRCMADFDVIDIKISVNQTHIDNYPKMINPAEYNHMWNICEFITAYMKPVKPLR